MVSKVLEELEAAVSPENLWKKKENCCYFRFSSKGLIIEELDLSNKFVNFEPTSIYQREAPTNYQIRVRKPNFSDTT